MEKADVNSLHMNSYFEKECNQREQYSHSSREPFPASRWCLGMFTSEGAFDASVGHWSSSVNKLGKWSATKFKTVCGRVLGKRIKYLSQAGDRMDNHGKQCLGWICFHLGQLNSNTPLGKWGTESSLIGRMRREETQEELWCEFDVPMKLVWWSNCGCEVQGSLLSIKSLKVKKYTC